MKTTNFMLDNVGAEGEANARYDEYQNQVLTKQRKSHLISAIHIVFTCCVLIWCALKFNWFVDNFIFTTLFMLILMSISSSFFSVLFAYIPDGKQFPIEYLYFNTIKDKKILKTELDPFADGFCLCLTFADKNDIVSTRVIGFLKKLQKTGIKDTVVDLRNRCVYIPYKELN